MKKSETAVIFKWVILLTVYQGVLGIECQDGYYGPTCRERCSVICVDRKCDKTSGACLACPPGRTGDHCNLALGITVTVEDSGLDVGDIVSIVVGILDFISIICGLAKCILRQEKKQKVTPVANKNTTITDVTSKDLSPFDSTLSNNWYVSNMRPNTQQVEKKAIRICSRMPAAVYIFLICAVVFQFFVFLYALLAGCWLQFAGLNLPTWSVNESDDSITKGLWKQCTPNCDTYDSDSLGLIRASAIIGVLCSLFGLIMPFLLSCFSDKTLSVKTAMTCMLIATSLSMVFAITSVILWSTNIHNDLNGWHYGIGWKLTLAGGITTGIGGLMVFIIFLGFTQR